MLASFSEFKFFQSFRIPVEEADNLRFLVQKEDEVGHLEYIDDAKLVDISVTGFGFKTHERISVGTELEVSLQFKKKHLDLTGRVVRAFSNVLEDEEIIYGVELDVEKGINKFLESYIMSFSSERLKDCLIQSALKERYTDPNEGFEMFSLLLSLFKDITHFGDKEGFLDTMLEEVIRILNAQRSSIFLINPDTNELEAIAALGLDKTGLKFDYRLGVAGSVFTTGVALNICTESDESRFNNAFDEQNGFTTKSIICYPIYNREDKIIGVIEVINKRNENRFTIEDEKTMKVLALVFSSVFHSFNPISNNSKIRRFSAPYDRQYAIIGNTAGVKSMRSSISKLKDLDGPVLITGEKGVGKNLYATVLHFEGKRGLHEVNTVNCKLQDINKLEAQLFGPDEDQCVFSKTQGGTVVLNHIENLSYEWQERLFEVISNRGTPGGIVSIDCRIMATSIKDLGILTDEGLFHRDLFEFLSQAQINIDPLRRREDDIEMLVEYFLKVECKRQGLLLKSFSKKVMEQILQYDWPGNIYELKKCIERAVLYHPKSHIISDIEINDGVSPLVDISMKQKQFGQIDHVTDFTLPLKDRLALVEREMILNEIKRNFGNKSKAAKEMGISREALRKKLIYSQEVLDNLGAPEVEKDKKVA